MSACRWGLMAIVVVFAAACDRHDVHWSYAGEAGPEHWASLSPEFSACASGERQSPIDIAVPADGGLPPIALQYGGRTTEVLNNGHAIQLNVEDGQTFTVGGKTWTLAQIHFHEPSEHTVDGERFPLEAHFVHRDEAGGLAVIGRLYRAGAADAGLSTILPALPAQAGDTRPLAIEVSTLAPPPDALVYVRYEGSLTTPPCTEGVAWHVLREVAEASTEQIDALERLTHANARPTQPVNGREVQR